MKKLLMIGLLLASMACVVNAKNFKVTLGSEFLQFDGDYVIKLDVVGIGFFGTGKKAAAVSPIVTFTVTEGVPSIGTGTATAADNVITIPVNTDRDAKLHISGRLNSGRAVVNVKESAADKWGTEFKVDLPKIGFKVDTTKK